jgi:bifunctional non-homologous end joining protein LigD
VIVTPQSTDADAMWDATRAQGFEGVMAKRRDSTYQPGKRSTSWRKAKHRRQQEFVVGGYLLGEGSRASAFGSLVVGVHDGGVLRHAGSVGSGLDDGTIAALLPRLRALETPTSPFEPVPKIAKARDRVRWVRPEIVVQVAFGEWTAGGHLRHPVFLGIRDDVNPGGVVREP